MLWPALAKKALYAPKQMGQCCQLLIGHIPGQWVTIHLPLCNRKYSLIFKSPYYILTHSGAAWAISFSKLLTIFGTFFISLIRSCFAACYYQQHYFKLCHKQTSGFSASESKSAEFNRASSTQWTLADNNSAEEKVVWPFIWFMTVHLTHQWWRTSV